MEKNLLTDNEESSSLRTLRMHVILGTKIQNNIPSTNKKTNKF